MNVFNCFGDRSVTKYTVTLPPNTRWFAQAGFNEDPARLVDFARNRCGDKPPEGAVLRAVPVRDINVVDAVTGKPYYKASCYAVVYDVEAPVIKFADSTCVETANGHVSIEDAQRLAQERDDAYNDYHRLANEAQMYYGRHHVRERELLAIIEKLGAKDSAEIILTGLDRRNLETDRRCAADKVAEEFDYEKLGYVYEEDSGWEHIVGDREWSKPVFLSDPDEPDAGTVKKTLNVTFKPDSSEIEEVWLS